MDDSNIMPSTDKFIIFLSKRVSRLQGIDATRKLLLKDNKVSFYSNEIQKKMYILHFIAVSGV